jgi:predicted MFS family arabinose efflux permease
MCSGSSYRRWLLVLLLPATSCSFVDRVIVQVLGQTIKSDLQLTDLQLGLLSGLSFAVVYSIAALPLARLAERRNRTRLISLAVAIFSVMTGLCALAHRFWQFVICRVGVGIGEAGVQPPAISLIADHFPAARRGSAIAIMQFGAPLGSFCGALGGGWIAGAFGWRAALLAVSVPGVLLALIMRIFLREPPRGMSDPVLSQHCVSVVPPLAEVLRTLWARRDFRHMWAGLALASMALYGSGAFLPAFFARSYDVGVARAATLYGVTSGVSSLIGVGFSGFGADWLGRRAESWYALLPALGLLLSLPLYMLGYSSEGPQVAVAWITAASAFMFWYQAPTMVAIQNMVGPRMRASAVFVYSFAATLLGVGFGPPLMGLFSDLFARRALAKLAPGATCSVEHVVHHSGSAVLDSCAAASTIGLRGALVVGAQLFLWAAFHYFRAFWIVRTRVNGVRKERTDLPELCQ